MDFDLTRRTGSSLRDSVARLTAGDRYGFETAPQGVVKRVATRLERGDAVARLRRAGPRSGCRPSPRSDGGFGGGAVETMIVMEEFGKALVLEPYLATVVLGGGFLRPARASRQRADLIAAIAAGELQACASPTPSGRRATTSPTSRRPRSKDGGGYVLDGAKGPGLHGDSADKLIVSARTAGRRSATATASALFLVDAEGAGRDAAAAIRRRTASAPPRSRFANVARRRRRR